MDKFVGRAREITALREGLRQGDSMVVIGGRQTGKTWLVHRIHASEVGRPVFLTSGDKLAFASEDLALRKLAKTLGVEWSGGRDAFEAREAIEERLREIGPCVLVIDETDRILGQPWAGGFLAWLRSLIDTAGLGRALAIVAVGGPILDHYRNPHDLGSPVLNLARRLFLDPLDDAAVDDLVAGRDGAPTADELRRAAGGQPALAQLFLREWQATPDATPEEVGRAMLATSRSHLAVWREQLGSDGRRFLRDLRVDGVAVADVFDEEGYLRARYLCLVRVEGDRIFPGPQAVVSHVLGAERPRYEVAISYAGEDGRLGRALHQGLVQRGVDVFFAEAETDWLWGKDLYNVLPNLFGQDAATIVVVCTAHYRRKHWTRLEYDAVRRSHGDRIVLLSLDGELPDDWPTGDLYLEGSPENLVRLADLVAKRARGE